MKDTILRNRLAFYNAESAFSDREASEVLTDTEKFAASYQSLTIDILGHYEVPP